MAAIIKNMKKVPIMIAIGYNVGLILSNNNAKLNSSKLKSTAIAPGI